MSEDEGRRGIGGAFVTRMYGEYIRDLIRRNKENKERAAYEWLKAELELAFAAPESSYQLLTAAEVIARNQS